MCQTALHLTRLCQAMLYAVCQTLCLAGDEALLDAAADVIAACSGLLACGGQVSNCMRYSRRKICFSSIQINHTVLLYYCAGSQFMLDQRSCRIANHAELPSMLEAKETAYIVICSASCRGLGSQASLGQVLHPNGACQCFQAQGRPLWHPHGNQHTDQ